MNLAPKVFAEFLGTAGLLTVVVGSGIMAEELAQGNLAVALLANSIATGAGLYALIRTFGPVSGAHLNPVVSGVEWLWRRISARQFFSYATAQIAGGFVGVFLTHAMFGRDILQLATRPRGGAALMLSELLATFGLILVISLSGRKNVDETPFAVAAYIASAYWWSASTSFANPAVTLARAVTDSFTGIAWTTAPGFIIAQCAGAALAFVVSRLFLR